MKSKARVSSKVLSDEDMEFLYNKLEVLDNLPLKSIWMTSQEDRKRPAQKSFAPKEKLSKEAKQLKSFNMSLDIINQSISKLLNYPAFTINLPSKHIQIDWNSSIIDFQRLYSNTPGFIKEVISHSYFAIEQSIFFWSSYLQKIASLCEPVATITYNG